MLSAAVPGLGQIYNGERAKGVAILCSTLGLWGGLYWSTLGPEASRSWLSALALAVTYPLVVWPAVLDAHRFAQGGLQAAPAPTGRWPVVLLLLVIGPFAIPQLWLHPGFSRRAKIAWTLLVVLIALAGILVMVLLGPLLESWLDAGLAQAL